jgi:hypothetical protein
VIFRLARAVEIGEAGFAGWRTVDKFVGKSSRVRVFADFIPQAQPKECVAGHLDLTAEFILHDSVPARKGNAV